MKHKYSKINVFVSSNCKPCGKEKNYIQKNPHAKWTQGTKKVQMVASGWNSIERKVIANIRMIRRFFKYHICHSFEVDIRLR